MAQDWEKLQEIIKNAPQRGVTLYWLLEGYKNREIADKMKINTSNVGNNLTQIYKKFNIQKEYGGNLQRKELKERLAKYKLKIRDLLINKNPKKYGNLLGESDTKMKLPVLNRPLTGLVPLDSPRYIQRETDEKCAEYLSTSHRGFLPFIRIKASQGMGKSSLLVRLKSFLKTEQKHIVAFIDLDSINFEPDSFTNLDKLLRRFTYAVTQAFQGEIKLKPPEIKDYWRDNLAPGVNCTNYLRDHVFSEIDKPKTLIIDGIDAVLGEQTQTPFLQLLRSWNEKEMKKVSQAELIWSSIVIAYSTEPYPDHNFKGSPMQNVGMAIELQEFSPNQIIELARRYNIEWSLLEAKSLFNLIGGHPALVNQALYTISQQDMSLEELQEQASQRNSPFQDYLLKYLNILENNPDLRDCFMKILEDRECKNEVSIFQLEKTGLIKLNNYRLSVRCELYKQYFQKHL